MRQHTTVHPGVLVPAAQVQDRHHGRRARSRRRQDPRHQPAAATGTSAGETGFEVGVGGGLGRIPYLSQTIRPFLAKRDLLSYIEAILRVYNQYGRRDNIHKARIKILVHQIGVEKFTREVEEEWQAIKDGPLALDPAAIADIAARFRYPDYERLADNPDS